jgi:hypothetical protein
MANERERTIWETVFGALAGVAGTVGFNSLFDVAKNRLQASITRTANEIVNDGGRISLVRDIMALKNSPEPMDAHAGEQVRLWLIQAQRETATGTITEGEIVNLLLKFPPNQSDDRKTVLRGLGSLPTYGDFIATMGMLRHDNVMQYAIKLAERLRSSGGTIIDDDLHAIRQALRTSLERFADGANRTAETISPHVQDLTAALRRFRESRRRA